MCAARTALCACQAREVVAGYTCWSSAPAEVGPVEQTSCHTVGGSAWVGRPSQTPHSIIFTALVTAIELKSPRAEQILVSPCPLTSAISLCGQVSSSLRTRSWNRAEGLSCSKPASIRIVRSACQIFHWCTSIRPSGKWLPGPAAGKPRLKGRSKSGHRSPVTTELAGRKTRCPYSPAPEPRPEIGSFSNHCCTSGNQCMYAQRSFSGSTSWPASTPNQGSRLRGCSGTTSSRLSKVSALTLRRSSSSSSCCTSTTSCAPGCFSNAVARSAAR
mmetsp:Transcript_45966/g.116321  ORF Transcript_45966/g.116321 Transcript_45966/m.116321 type:complete len:273 (+) Transcript_45966:130-948(+)